MSDPTPSGVQAATDHSPIGSFSHSHDGIVRHLEAMKQLPELLRAAQRAREIAEQTRSFFRDVIFEHHQEEERALFEAVLASASEGEELAQMKAAIDRLTREHRTVEAVCKQLEPDLKKMAKGQPCNLDLPAIEQLIAQYGAHARYEEDEFLPRADRILSRNANHMAALGVALHIRQVNLPDSAT